MIGRMTNYSESSAKADNSTYRRVRYIGIWNPPTGPAQLQILEADALFINGVKRHLDENVGGINLTLSPDDTEAMTEAIPLKNPQTDAVVEGQTFTRAQLWAMLYSWAQHEQATRDALMDPSEQIVIEDSTAAPTIVELQAFAAEAAGDTSAANAAASQGV